ncbi:MAG: hypothetical protein AAFN81_14460 [Bacteroidota bacterium]
MTLSRILLITIVVLFGCKEEICPDEVTGETYLISKETASLILPYEGISKVYFKDSTGVEFEFVVSEIINEIVPYNHTQKCAENQEINQQVVGEREYYEFSLRSEVFEKQINIRLREVPPAINGRENNEALEIIYGDPAEGVSQSDVLLYHTPLIELQTSMIIDEIELNGVQYQDVIISSGTAVPPKFELYYTSQRGIIFIRNKETNYRLYYQRSE